MPVFGVANRDAWENVWTQPLVSFRKSKAFESDTAALAAWLRIGELEAAAIECEPFDTKIFRDSLRKVREITTRPVTEWVAGIVGACANAGVAVVFVPEIKGCRASGAARWLSPAKAVIQLSVRHKSDDHLWFSFFHEAGHLLLHSKKQTYITNETERDVAENEADEFSSSYLIPRQFRTRVVGLGQCCIDSILCKEDWHRSRDCCGTTSEGGHSGLEPTKQPEATPRVRR